MIRVTSRKELPDQTAAFIYVVREKIIYRRIGEEYVAKRYFFVQDVMDITKFTRDKVHKLCVKLGIQSKANKGKKLRITLEQLRLIISTSQTNPTKS